MQYNKSALTFSEQADQLLKRGLIADREKLVSVLENISYYRLSAYWYPFRNQPEESFYQGITLDKILNRYFFDRELRILVLDAVEWVEISVRTHLTYHFSHENGPFGYTIKEHLPHLTPNQHEGLLDALQKETKRSREIFVKHFFDRYGKSHSYLPLWMVTEIMTFGTMLTIFRGLDNHLKRKISSEYNIPYRVFESWLTAINGLRNIAAHHARLWNRESGFSPKIPRIEKHSEWHKPVEISNERIFGVLSIIKYLLDKINTGNEAKQWMNTLKKLFVLYPDIPSQQMGSPKNWEESPIWKRSNS